MQPYPGSDTARLRGAKLDRAAEHRNDPQWLEAQWSGADWLAIWRYRSPIEDGQPQLLSWADIGSPPAQPIFLGLRSDTTGPRAIFCFDANGHDDLTERLSFADLRGAVPVLSTDDAALLAYARAMIYWQRQHRHCGRCGGKTSVRSGGHVLYCEPCDVEHYPRSDPSMLCLAIDPADRALLGQQPQWPKTLFSVLAGFAEPGETIEDCVAREIWEEARVRVHGTEYLASQPWPFPASLLMGFLAQAHADEPQTEQDELAAAAWFSRDDIASGLRERRLHIPPPFTLSYHLLETWFNRGDCGPLLKLIEGD